MQTHAKWAQEYGPVYTSFGGTRPFVFTDQPDLVRQVLLQHSSRPMFPTIWQGKEREFDKASILAVRGDKHKSVRSAWQPMFFTGRQTQLDAHYCGQTFIHGMGSSVSSTWGLDGVRCVQLGVILSADE